MKKILLLILSLLMFACTNNTSIEEDKEAQISRLLKEADKKREETEKIVINEKIAENSEIVSNFEKIQKIR